MGCTGTEAKAGLDFDVRFNEVLCYTRAGVTTVQHLHSPEKTSPTVCCVVLFPLLPILSQFMSIFLNIFSISFFHILGGMYIQHQHRNL